MERRFRHKIKMYFNCLNILLVSSAILFSCSSSKNIYRYNSECEFGGSTEKKSTDPGNYFYMMKMSKHDFESMSKKQSLKRFIFQFKNVRSENGRNEYEMASFTWNKGLFVKDTFNHVMFLKRDDLQQILWVDPKVPFSFVNLELRKKNIKKDAFKSTDSICFIPYYDKCKKVMSLKMVSSSSQIDNSYKKPKIKTNPNYAISASFKTTGSEIIEGQYSEEELLRFLDLPSELEINPCPPDIPRGS